MSRLTSNFPIRLIACLSLASATMLGGCADADSDSLEDVKKFDAYSVYYADDEVAGLKLEDVEGEDWQEDERLIRWSFIYGNCTPPAEEDESSCAPPLQIQNYSTCRRWASISKGKARLFDFRGAKAAGSGGYEDSLEIFTGRTTVVIYAERQNDALAAARELRSVHEAEPSSRLPPPVPGSLSGKLSCQIHPG